MKRIYCYVITWRTVNNKKKEWFVPVAWSFLFKYPCLFRVSTLMTHVHATRTLKVRHELWWETGFHGSRFWTMHIYMRIYACELTHGMHYEHKWRVLAIFLWQFLNAWCFHTRYSLKRLYFFQFLNYCLIIT